MRKTRCFQGLNALRLGLCQSVAIRANVQRWDRRVSCSIAARDLAFRLTFRSLPGSSTRDGRLFRLGL